MRGRTSAVGTGGPTALRRPPPRPRTARRESGSPSEGRRDARPPCSQRREARAGARGGGKERGPRLSDVLLGATAWRHARSHHAGTSRRSSSARTMARPGEAPRPVGVTGGATRDPASVAVSSSSAPADVIIARFVSARLSSSACAATADRRRWKQTQHVACAALFAGKPTRCGAAAAPPGAAPPPLTAVTVDGDQTRVTPPSSSHWVAQWRQRAVGTRSRAVASEDPPPSSGKSPPCGQIMPKVGLSGSASAPRLAPRRRSHPFVQDRETSHPPSVKSSLASLLSPADGAVGSKSGAMPLNVRLRHLRAACSAHSRLLPTSAAASAPAI